MVIAVYHQIMSAKAEPEIPSDTNVRLTLRLRLVAGENILLGPGKIELLGHIAETGSISEAAKRMNMSYNRAWLHVKVMNEAFLEPLVSSSRGGSSGGGATLTTLGHEVVSLFQKMQKEAELAAEKSHRQLSQLIRR